MSPSQILSRILFEFSYWEAIRETPFKPRAYSLASEAVYALGDDIERTWRENGIKGLKELPAIGQAIAEKIDEWFRSGQIKEYEQMKRQFPVDIWGLAQIEGLGPKHIGDLYRRLRIKNVEDLKAALEKQRIQKLSGWGKRSEERLAKQVQLLASASGRKLLADVLPVAEQLAQDLKRHPDVKDCVYAGSLRRRQETIGDIDMLATSAHPEKVMQAFTTHPLVETVHEQGKTRASVRLKIGIDADLRVVPQEVFGATLQYFTGDKRHNVLLRSLALRKGYTLNEYGLFNLKAGRKGHTKGTLVVCKTEGQIYRKLGMDTPPPEIRIGGDELEAAQKHQLPKLLPYHSVKGDLQVQSNWTDGSASIKDMALAAKKTGLSYIAITDHTKALAFIHGLDEKRLAEQGKEIDALNKSLNGITILKGTECDISEDGSLDLSDAALAKLDWVGVSIHSHFHLSRQQQTARIVKAISHPGVHCLFHPSARRIGKRDPIDIDLDQIFAACKKYHVALEIDAAPERSDLRDLHVRAAVKAGIKLVIDSDAHDPGHFRFLEYGEAIARRGWASKNDILNTGTLKQLKQWSIKKHPLA